MPHGMPPVEAYISVRWRPWWRSPLVHINALALLAGTVALLWPLPELSAALAVAVPLANLNLRLIGGVTQ